MSVAPAKGAKGSSAEASPVRPGVFKPGSGRALGDQAAADGRAGTIVFMAVLLS
jgi:hypothetical protein